MRGLLKYRYKVISGGGRGVKSERGEKPRRRRNSGWLLNCGLRNLVS